MGASVFAPFLAALTSTLRDQSCFEAVEWPLYRVGTGEKLESRETPCHATPHHHAGAAQRNKTREMRRCDTRLDPTAIICSNRVERSGAAPRGAAPTRRVDHSQLTLPLATAVKLYPSRTFCLPSAWASRVY